MISSISAATCSTIRSIRLRQARCWTQIHADRGFDGSLFLSEAEFDADPQYTGVNPKPGRNLLERFEDQLGFIECSPAIVSALTTLLGSGYEILNRKIVCGLPDSILPTWVKTRIAGGMVNNLGCFMRPEYRDMTYFYGIDFHQDLIDYKDRDADFVTLYSYLHPVTAQDAPLFLLDGSHRLGATVFPHDLKRQEGPTDWRYGDRQGRRGDGSSARTDRRDRLHRRLARLHAARDSTGRGRPRADFAALSAGPPRRFARRHRRRQPHPGRTHPPGWHAPRHRRRWLADDEGQYGQSGLG